MELIKGFSKYFPESDYEKPGVLFIRNPFQANVSSVSIEFQNEFLELKSDLLASDLFMTTTLEIFWCKMLKIYPRISLFAIRHLLPFTSTYMCECGFSSLLHIKNKQRNNLDVENDIRCARSEERGVGKE